MVVSITRIQSALNSLTYVVCSKSIEPSVGRNTFIDLEVQNPNPLQSSLLGNAHTLLPALPPLLETLLERVFWNGDQPGRRIPHVFS
jgi:hypothetical protein